MQNAFPPSVDDEKLRSHGREGAVQLAFEAPNEIRVMFICRALQRCEEVSLE
jgi:hypothetical protein